MEPPSSSGPSPKPGAFATGLAIAILVTLIAAVIGISFLPNPYYVIGQGVIIAGLWQAVPPSSAIATRSRKPLDNRRSYTKLHCGVSLACCPRPACWWSCPLPSNGLIRLFWW